MSAESVVAPDAPRILVVDDERKNRQLLEVMLHAEGYRVEMASVGTEALDMVRANPPHLVLLDVMMPGMDGYQVVARIKSDPGTRHIPVIMLTALDDRNSRMHSLAAGAEAYLAKPVNRDELTVVVRNLLRLTS